MLKNPIQEIPQDRPYIVLQGEGSQNTAIDWNNCGTIDRLAFASFADHFVAKYICFMTHQKAVAGQIAGDDSAFYGCAFHGLQDTFCNNVFGSGTITYLGRGWGAYSRVIFYQSELSNVVVPQGWDAWKSAEYCCRASGSDTSERLPWEMPMDRITASNFSDISYIDQEGWLHNQP
ncbi:hypothetical protein AQUCO_01500004v1 [Aquilegia coerulea]|uniref:pectinesterase n=1 Tax=Aquilegia coerulea TaxID=218851 RepID=A0A2G5DRN6_AQUCA|nr:hypothetical protein AQUCO_01500004v1 [Aquilegia coerulea]